MELLTSVLRHWEPNSRSRQQAHDRFRQLWRQAGWEWPAEVAGMRGNGKAAASPEGVRSFTDGEIAELRARIQRSRRLTPGDLLAWDVLIVFGLRPAELKGLELVQQEEMLLAKVSRSKKSSKGSIRLMDRTAEKDAIRKAVASGVIPVPGLASAAGGKEPAGCLAVLAAIGLSATSLATLALWLQGGT